MCRLALAVPLLVLSVTACGGSPATPAPAGGSSGPAATATGAATADVTATDKDNGHELRVRGGQRIRIVLSSTYWNFQGSSDSTVLRAEGAAQVSPQPGCVPGAGCGTATATYRAVAPGRATVTATRRSCGEAMGCASGNDRYTLTVVVSP